MSLYTIRRWTVIGGAIAVLAALSAVRTEAGGGKPKGPPPPGKGTNTVSTNVVVTLTDAQEQALKDAHTAIVTQSETLLAQLETAREALEDAILADVPSEAAIRAAAAVIGEIKGSLAVIRATELAKIRPLFTADEWAKLRTVGLFDRRLFEVHGPGKPSPDTTSN